MHPSDAMNLFSRSAIVPTGPDASDASLVLKQEIIAWYFLVSILALLVYDAVTTIDKEVKYFWVLPLKPVVVVYFANRYIGLLGAVSNLFIDTFNATLTMCKFAIWSRSLSYWATIVLIDYILMLRVLALYSKDGRLMKYLNLLLILSAAIKLGILIYITTIQEIAVYKVATEITICGERRSASVGLGIADWLSPMAYGIILLFLAFRKARLYLRMTLGFSGAHLVKVIIHDQVIYFVLVVLCCILNILQFKIRITNNILAGIISTVGSPSLLCILGSRMLFNLKEAGEIMEDEAGSRLEKSTSIEFETIGTIPTHHSVSFPASTSFDKT